jgi:hypothetical protein
VKSVLVDIDHTISNAFWRDAMIGVVTWDEYHQSSEKDLPLYDMVALVRLLHNCYNIIGITARPEKFRSLTMSWCLKNGVMFDELLMRDYDSFTPAPITKLQLIERRFSKPAKEIAFALEDRDDCCAALRGLGITVLQVFGKRHEETLHNDDLQPARDGA